MFEFNFNRLLDSIESACRIRSAFNIRNHMWFRFPDFYRNSPDSDRILIGFLPDPIIGFNQLRCGEWIERIGFFERTILLVIPVEVYYKNNDRRQLRPVIEILISILLSSSIHRKRLEFNCFIRKKSLKLAYQIMNE
jgi:hypothetical protein